MVKKIFEKAYDIAIMMWKTEKRAQQLKTVNNNKCIRDVQIKSHNFELHWK